MDYDYQLLVGEGPSNQQVTPKSSASERQGIRRAQSSSEEGKVVPLGQRGTESSLEDRYLCSLMNSSGLEELKDFLERETSIDLTRIVDDQGYTLAHLAT